LVLDKMV